MQSKEQQFILRRSTISVNPHFSPAFVARREKWLWLQGLRPRTPALSGRSLAPPWRSPKAYPLRGACAERQRSIWRLLVTS